MQFIELPVMLRQSKAAKYVLNMSFFSPNRISKMQNCAAVQVSTRQETVLPSSGLKIQLKQTSGTQRAVSEFVT